LVLAVAAISWFAIERPVLRLVKQRRPQQNTAAPLIGSAIPVVAD
jgi:hypothetical protein